MMTPRAFYHMMGKRNFLQYIFFAAFLFFFYVPLMNLCMLAFADKYEVPAIIPQKFGFKWWEFVLDQNSLMGSITTSFALAIVVTAVSMLICIPAAYALARYNFRGKRIFLLSFLLSNAYPRMGLYISIGILFYKLNLMGTFLGVVIIHVVNSLMFMTWIPSGSFKSVYRQQEESARDAGAGPLRTFFSITLPLAMPGIAVGGVFTFLGSLEEAQGTLLVGFPENHAGRALRGDHGISSDCRTGIIVDLDHSDDSDPARNEKIPECRYDLERLWNVKRSKLWKKK